MNTQIGKNDMKRLILTPIFFLLGGCGFILDNDYTVKLKNGDTLEIKKSNTKCTKDSSSMAMLTIRGARSAPSGPSLYEQFYECTANGVITDLVGYQSTYSKTIKKCQKNSTYIPCKAGAYFNMIDEDYFFTGKVENRCYRADGSKKFENSKKCLFSF